MYSFQTLSFLQNASLIDILRQSGNNDLSLTLSKKGFSSVDIFNFTLWISVANTIGLLVAFGISLAISIKRKWFWLNSLLVLFIMLVLNQFDMLGWKYLKRIFLMPGEISQNITLEFLINGLILLVLGILTFFWARTNQFIAKRRSSNLTIK